MEETQRSSPSLSGKVALVTGGGKRIGAEICRTLSKSGVAIIVHAHRSIVESKNLVAEIRGFGGKAELVVGDLSFDEGRRSVVEGVLASEIYQSTGGLDILVNSASRFSKSNPDEPLEKQRIEMFAINFDAPSHLISSFSETLSKRNGTIINIVDAILERSDERFQVYCDSKIELVKLTLVKALELAPSIRVNAIGPGAIIASEDEIDIVDKITQQIPLERWGDMQDIASAVLFLASSPYITGQILNVDGGWSLVRNQS